MGFILIIILICACLILAGRKMAARPAVLNYIEMHLPSEGVLKKECGFIYVDVDDAYIHQLVQLIEKEGFQKPPYFGSPELVGAHITVASAEEAAEYGVKEIEEEGQIIRFTPKVCQVVHPPKWEGIEKACCVLVEAPELDAIRKKYGFPKRPYDFHITIGIKPKVAQSA